MRYAFLFIVALSSFLMSQTQLQVKDLPDPWKFAQRQKPLTPWDAPTTTVEELDAVKKLCLAVLPIEAVGKYAYLKDCSIGRIVPVYRGIGRDSTPDFYFAEALKDGKSVATLYVTGTVQLNFSKPPIKFWQDEAMKRAQSIVNKHWRKGVHLGAAWMTERHIIFHIYHSPKWKEVEEYTWTVPVLSGNWLLGFVCVDPWTGDTRLWKLPTPVGKEGIDSEQAKAIAWGYIQIFGLHEIYNDLQSPKEVFFQEKWKKWSVNLNSKIVTSPIKDDPNSPYDYRGASILIQFSKYGELIYLWVIDPSIEWFVIKGLNK